MKRPANASKGGANKKHRSSSKGKPKKHGKPSKPTKKAPAKSTKHVSKVSGSTASQKPIVPSPQSNDTKDEKKITIPTNHREQKLLRLERKAARSPMFEVVQELNKLYEQVRIKRVPKEERDGVIEKCFNIVRGHLLEV